LNAQLDIPAVVDASVGPRGSLEMLSQSEIEALLSSDASGVHELFRKCALAVLNSGTDKDNAKELFERFSDFNVGVVRHPWGIRLDIRNAPASAFVDGQMINGIKEHLFAVLRDVVFIAHEIDEKCRFDLSRGEGITNAVFHVLRNARILDRRIRPNLVVCWGGHSIGESEYQYTKRVGYEMGLRGLDVCTGCGPGAMKGPMKGATIVNQLVVMPDIEKRLEAFVRLAHGVVVFPGGVGTLEEILYLLGLLLDPDNAAQPLPVILTGPESSAGYFEQIRKFLAAAVGPAALDRLQIIHADRSRTSPACVPTGAPAATPTPLTGCCASLRNSSTPSWPRTRACAGWSCTATSRRTAWWRTCGGRSRGSWRAT
jgi:predicted Rossmann-fold nucleotide-binding protein